MEAILYHGWTKLDEQGQPAGFTDCPDGICAAVIAAQATGITKLVPVDYLTNDQYEAGPNTLMQEGYQRLIVVDISFPRQWLEELQSTGTEVLVIDHHMKKLQGFDLANFSNAVFPGGEDEDCGATLTWKHFYPENPLPPMLQHVRRRDIGLDGYYDGQCPDSEAINEGLGLYRREIKSLPNRDQIDHLFAMLISSKAEEILLERGRPAIEERDQKISEFMGANPAEWINIWGQQAPLLELPPEVSRWYSIIANRLIQQHPYSNFAMVRTPDGKLHFRSTGYDTVPLAEAMGGGGHPKASGTGDQEKIQEMLKGHKMLQAHYARNRQRLSSSPGDVIPVMLPRNFPANINLKLSPEADTMLFMGEDLRRVQGLFLDGKDLPPE
jgi:uncharacterized protein